MSDDAAMLVRLPRKLADALTVEAGERKISRNALVLEVLERRARARSSSRAALDLEAEPFEAAP